MHTSTELARFAKISLSTALATLRAHKTPFTSVRKSGSGGKPKKLFHISLEEFQKIQSERKPGRGFTPVSRTPAAISTINDLLYKSWR